MSVAFTEFKENDKPLREGGVDSERVRPQPPGTEEYTSWKWKLEDLAKDAPLQLYYLDQWWDVQMVSRDEDGDTYAVWSEEYSTQHEEVTVERLRPAWHWAWHEERGKWDWEVKA